VGSAFDIFRIKCATRADRYMRVARVNVIMYHHVINGSSPKAIFPEEEGSCIIPEEFGRSSIVEFRVSERMCNPYKEGVEGKHIKYPRVFQVIAQKNGSPLPAKYIGQEDSDALFSLPILYDQSRSLVVFQIKLMEEKVLEIFTVDISKGRNIVYIDIPAKEIFYYKDTINPQRIRSSIIIHLDPDDKKLHFKNIVFPRGTEFLRRYGRAIDALFEKYNRWVVTGENTPVYYLGSPYKGQKQSTLKLT